jgi:hypothetical protein
MNLAISAAMSIAVDAILILKSHDILRISSLDLLSMYNHVGVKNHNIKHGI